MLSTFSRPRTRSPRDFLVLLGRRFTGGPSALRLLTPKRVRGKAESLRLAALGYIATIGRMARRAETIELAVLGLLHEGPMHGYELRKRLNLMLGWGRVLSYGSLYPALKKMLRAGLLEVSGGAATSRRPKIAYQSTDAGLAE